MRYLLLLALCFPCFASAQDKPQNRTCRVLMLNPPANPPEKIFLFDGTSAQEIELPKMNFSDVYTIAGGDANIHLLKAPVIKPEEVPAGSPIGKLPAAIGDCYLIITGDPTNQVIPLRMQFIDAGAQSFKKGQMMWYNLTGHAVGGQLGSQKLALKPQSRSITDAPARGEEAYDVNLSYVIAGESEFNPICQTKWVHDSRSRMVMFVHGGENKTTPIIEGFKDFRSEEEKK